MLLLRVTGRVAVFALVGAVLTVLVAWGCAVAIPTPRAQWSRLQWSDGIVWGAEHAAQSGAETTLWLLYFAAPESPPPGGRPVSEVVPLCFPGIVAGPDDPLPGVPIQRLTRPRKAPPGEDNPSGTARWLEHARGWPMTALWCEQALDFYNPRYMRFVGAIDLPAFARRANTSPFALRALPLRPLWPGFLVDTIFFGGLAFAVWSAPGFVRRRSRRRRGACVRCGYDLNGTGGAVCPECGAGEPRGRAASHDVPPPGDAGP